MEGHSRQAPWRSHVSVLAPSLTMVVLIAILAINVVNALGAVRAYVGGESLWSKARNEAMQHLLQYGKSHDPADLAAFRAALKPIENNRLARETMSRPELDQPLARAQLIAGGNHPDDVNHMIVLFRRYGDLWVFKDALADWVRADGLIDELKLQANHLQALRTSSGSQAQEARALETISRINANLKTLELRFTANLGHASRLTETALIGSVALIAATLSLLSIVLTRRALSKQAQHQADLSAINKRWELASASAGLGVYELDAATQAVHLDAKAASLHGLPSRACVVERSRLSALVVPEDLVTASAQIDEALSSGGVFNTTYRVQVQGQGPRTLAATGRLVQKESATTVRMVGVMRDVTDEMARAETALQRDAAERVAKTQRQFLSRLSHELRTPLNAILGFAQLMLLDRTRPLHSTHERQTQLILTAGKQLLTLIEDVMDLSKVESGDIPMTLQAVDVVTSVQACIPLVDGIRAQMDLTVVDQLPPQPLMVQADPHRLQQVVMNLLSNACKYNRPGGKIEIGSRQDGQHVVIHISDTGIGLSAEDAEQLFQPFKRIAPQPEIEGTGLGLYIIKQLVERMNGSVSVQSQPGVGSCFTVRLPLACERAVPQIPDSLSH